MSTVGFVVSGGCGAALVALAVSDPQGPQWLWAIFGAALVAQALIGAILRD